MKDFVLDCSIAVAWILRDEANKRADAVLDRLESGHAHVPQHWPLEVANALCTAQRCGRITSPQAQIALEKLLLLPISIEFLEPAAIFRDVLYAAGQYKLSVYDAAYLELAQKRGLPLATLDHGLGRAALTCGVKVL